MRRTANLFDLIADPENVRLAFYRAARGKRSQSAIVDFSENLDMRVRRISEWIENGIFPLGRFHQFIIRDPKERIITAPCFDERVLHHAIMNICEPIMDRWLIDDTFGRRQDAGHAEDTAAIRVLQNHLAHLRAGDGFFQTVERGESAVEESGIAIYEVDHAAVFADLVSRRITNAPGSFGLRNLIVPIQSTNICRSSSVGCFFASSGGMSCALTLASACFHVLAEEGAPGAVSVGAKLMPPSIL